LTVIVQHGNFERKEIYGGIFHLPGDNAGEDEIAPKALLRLPSEKE